MNKVFTQKSKIELDLNWDLTSDGDYGLVLTFSETRQRDKTVKENGKTIKTGEKEDYLYESKTYHTRVAQALRYYVEKSLNKCKTLEEIISKEDKLLSIIEDLDRNFKQF
jgi:hypothetical protein